MKKYLKGKWGIASIVFGALMFALAFVPYVLTRFGSTNLYNLLELAFNGGFGEGFGLALVSMGAIIYVLAAVYAIVMGVLMLLKVVKTEKLDLIGYATGFGAVLLTFIGLLIIKISLANTLVYIPLVLTGLVLGYKLLEMLKK